MNLICQKHVSLIMESPARLLCKTIASLPRRMKDRTSIEYVLRGRFAFKMERTQERDDSRHIFN